MLYVTVKKIKIIKNNNKNKNKATLDTTSCIPELGLTVFFFNEILIVLLSRYWNGVYEC